MDLQLQKHDPSYAYATQTRLQTLFYPKYSRTYRFINIMRRTIKIVEDGATFTTVYSKDINVFFFFFLLPLLNISGVAGAAATLGGATKSGGAVIISGPG